jgi:hypothetical protein
MMARDKASRLRAYYPIVTHLAVSSNFIRVPDPNEAPLLQWAACGPELYDVGSMYDGFPSISDITCSD